MAEGMEFDQIEEVESGLLERKFDRDEIVNVVRNMEGDKSPWPNGFSWHFSINVGG